MKLALGILLVPVYLVVVIVGVLVATIASVPWLLVVMGAHIAGDVRLSERLMDSAPIIWFMDWVTEFQL